MSWGTLKEEVGAGAELPRKCSAAAWGMEGNSSRWEMKYGLGPRYVFRVCVINCLHLSNHPVSQRAAQSFSLAVNSTFLTGVSQRKWVTMASASSPNNQPIKRNQRNPLPAKNCNRYLWQILSRKSQNVMWIFLRVYCSYSFFSWCFMISTTR